MRSIINQIPFIIFYLLLLIVSFYKFPSKSLVTVPHVQLSVYLHSLMGFGDYWKYYQKTKEEIFVTVSLGLPGCFDKIREMDCCELWKLIFIIEKRLFTLWWLKWDFNFKIFGSAPWWACWTMIKLFTNMKQLPYCFDKVLAIYF